MHGSGEEIVASDLTSRRTRDGTRVCALLEQIADPVAALSADGGYDAKGVYEAARGKGDLSNSQSHATKPVTGQKGP